MATNHELIPPMRTKGKVVYKTKPKPKPDAPGMLPNQDQKQNQNQPQRPKGKMTKGEKPPVPNWRCYPEAFEGLVDEHGNWLGKGKVPSCRKCSGLLHPKENHVCPGFIPKCPMLPSTKVALEERKAMRQEARDDWDDDQYDPTTEGDIPVNPDEEDSGTVAHCEHMTEEEWIAAKRRRMGLSPGYDVPDFEPEEDRFDNEIWFLICPFRQ